MKRPKIDPDSHYSLTEATRATGIPRGVLDHACRSGRLPFRQTEGGTRLLSGRVVAQLARDRDLRSFPKAYDPPPGPAPNLGYEEEPPAHGSQSPSAAERLGLLGEPSQELKRAKEQAEAEKLQAEQEEAKLRQEQSRLERERLRREHQEELDAKRRAQDEELRAEDEAEAERLRLEAEARRRAERERQRREETEAWIRSQFNEALDEASGDLFGMPDSDQAQVKEEILLELGRELERLNPHSPFSACAAARRAAVTRVLAPFRYDKLIRKVFSCWRNPIKERLDQLYQDGWLKPELDESHRQFLAQRWEPEVRERIRREYDRRGGLTEAEAQEVIQRVIDEKLGLNRRRNRPT